MKKGIHPQYYPKAKVICACGAKYTIGSTRESMNIEICASCHPFYTGDEKVVDTAGRIEKFRARSAAAKPKAVAEKKQKKVQKIKAKIKEKPGAKNFEKRASAKTGRAKKR